MTTSALVLMLTTMVTVTLFTGYFFWKVVRTPPKPDTDDETKDP
jgi:hypothetical protein